MPVKKSPQARAVDFVRSLRNTSRSDSSPATSPPESPPERIPTAFSSHTHVEDLYSIGNLRDKLTPEEHRARHGQCAPEQGRSHEEDSIHHEADHSHTAQPALHSRRQQAASPPRFGGLTRWPVHTVRGSHSGSEWDIGEDDPVDFYLGLEEQWQSFQAQEESMRRVTGGEIASRQLIRKPLPPIPPLSPTAASTGSAHAACPSGTSNASLGWEHTAVHQGLRPITEVSGARQSATTIPTSPALVLPPRSTTLVRSNLTALQQRVLAFLDTIQLDASIYHPATYDPTAEILLVPPSQLDRVRGLQRWLFNLPDLETRGLMMGLESFLSSDRLYLLRRIIQWPGLRIVQVPIEGNGEGERQRERPGQAQPETERRVTSWDRWKFTSRPFSRG